MIPCKVDYEYWWWGGGTAACVETVSCVFLLYYCMFNFHQNEC